MVSISFESNIREWMKSLDNIQHNQLPFAIKEALNDTAQEMQSETRQSMGTVFNRPTRFTLNSLRIGYATVHKLEAGVFFKDLNFGKHYLLPQVDGGTRPHKTFEKWLIKRGLMSSSEYAVPGRAIALDSYGNISGGVMMQILSQLSLSSDPMQWETKRSRKRAGANRARYFVPKRGGALPAGVWRRGGNNVIEPVLIFVRAPNYGKRFAFHEINTRVAGRNFPRNLDIAWKRALATAK